LTPDYFSGKPSAMKDEPLIRLIEQAGGLGPVADCLGITKQAVSAWERVPVDRAHALSEAFGVPLHRIRPDVWRTPSEAAVKESEAAAKEVAA
jgi:hypothetical protein